MVNVLLIRLLSEKALELPREVSLPGLSPARV